MSDLLHPEESFLDRKASFLFALARELKAPPETLVFGGLTTKDIGLLVEVVVGGMAEMSSNAWDTSRYYAPMCKLLELAAPGRLAAFEEAERKFFNAVD